MTKHLVMAGFASGNIEDLKQTKFTVACVASGSVQFGSKELLGDEWSE